MKRLILKLLHGLMIGTLLGLFGLIWAVGTSTDAIADKVEGQIADVLREAAMQEKVDTFECMIEGVVLKRKVRTVREANESIDAFCARHTELLKKALAECE